MKEVFKIRILLTYFTLCLLLTGVATNVSAQQMIGVSAAYEFFPLNTFSASASFPLVFAKGKTIFVNSIAYQYSVYDYDDWGFVQGSADDTEQFHSVSFTLLFMQQFSSKWHLLVTVTPGLASDFEGDISIDDSAFKGKLMFIHKFNEALSLGPGVTYSLRDKPIFPLPFLRFEWIIRSKVIVQGVVPDNATILYRANRVVDLGITAKTMSVNHHGDPGKYAVDNPWLKYSDFSAGPIAQLHISKWLHLSVEGGYTFLRRFKFFDGNDEKNSIDLGSKGYLKAGLKVGM